MELSTHAASKAELMAAITTTRYQQMRLRINPSKTVEDEEDYFDTPGLKTLSKCPVVTLTCSISEALQIVCASFHRESISSARPRGERKGKEIQGGHEEDGN